MSGRYVTVDTEVWIDDSDIEMYLEDFNNEELIAELERRRSDIPVLYKHEKLIHEIYVARTQDKVEEVNRLLDQLFLGVLDKRV
jgi:glycyl-tRNA synthetase beta subunit